MDVTCQVLGPVASASTRMRFHFKTQTFCCVFMSRLHQNDENDVSFSMKTQTFENDLQSGKIWKRNSIGVVWTGRWRTDDSTKDYIYLFTLELIRWLKISIGKLIFNNKGWYERFGIKNSSFRFPFPFREMTESLVPEVFSRSGAPKANERWGEAERRLTARSHLRRSRQRENLWDQGREPQGVRENRNVVYKRFTANTLAWTMQQPRINRRGLASDV